jgi:hypothetical protein
VGNGHRDAGLSQLPVSALVDIVIYATSCPGRDRGFCRALIFCRRGRQACYLYLVAIDDILAKYLAYTREGNHMSKSMDTKKAEKKKPQKTPKEKKLAKQEKKKKK